ncbi:hypothetical protein [Proteiniphilum sp.]|uniref:hypothetical protein n=1 Tax=Proteiniphilum sp. TaxID=1926877 RepID=UPI0033300252
METKNKDSFSLIPSVDMLQNEAMSRIMGGTKDDEEVWEIVYIDGKPHLVRRNGAGIIIEMKALY